LPLPLTLPGLLNQGKYFSSTYYGFGMVRKDCISFFDTVTTLRFVLSLDAELLSEKIIKLPKTKLIYILLAALLICLSGS
jgi:hypothetical protein